MLSFTAKPDSSLVNTNIKEFRKLHPFEVNETFKAYQFREI